MKTYSLFTLLDFCHAAGADVFAQHKSQEGRQGSPLLQRGGESSFPGGKTVQRTVLYLGEINDQQQAAWRKRLEVFDESEQRYVTVSCSGRPGSARRCLGQRAGKVERAGIASVADVRQLLAGL